MYRIKSGFIFLLCFAALGIPSWGQAEKSGEDYYYKLNKSFEIYGAVFREISQNYVLDIDPEDLMNESINGMLESLDPYTIYMNESESDDIDLLTSGSYVGLGITVSVRDSHLTIVDLHDGYPAQRSGIKIGDLLYKIDTTIVIDKSSDDLRKYTKGAPGSNVDVWVIRPVKQDTLMINIIREEIKVNNVSYSGIVADSIGYIKLDRFSRYSAEEVRTAFNELKRKHNIKGLILDLRDNPGGLLESAVDICEIFVPTNTKIVTTRGRMTGEEREYRSQAQPLDTNIALAVLINEFSASASEVVAGAIQDLDRGVIIGEKSFGKGLVQSVFDLPYNTNLKITTARYYTPSGRSIQKHDYNPKADHKLVSARDKDTLFTTINGRNVVESKGIIPDSIVESETYPDFIIELFKNNVIFNYATEYAATHNNLPERFAVTQGILDDFGNFLKKTGFTYKSPIEKNLDTLKILADNERFDKKTIKEINELERIIKTVEKSPVVKYSEELKKILGQEIYRRYHNETETLAYNVGMDDYVDVAINLLSPRKYNRILMVSNKASEESKH